MNNYQCVMSSSTSSSALVFVASGLMCTAFVMAPIGTSQALPAKYLPIGTHSYSQDSSDSTASFIAVKLTPNVNTSAARFEESVARFYDKLLSQQEPLGEKFAAVLEENLWDLYVRA